ncbi:MAG: CatA-like O-acetyltransferase, family 3 [Eubacteriales bacterium]|nr:CatA-like O-acetyltransferase, family 3 [Eubacteriales bacterium]
MKTNAATSYRILDMESYYRKGVYRHFTKDCKCSTSITARLDVTELYNHAKKQGTKFYIDFMYLLSKTLNSRDDYKTVYFWQTDTLRIYNKVNPIQYIFHEDTETCTPVYTEYFEDYNHFYQACAEDIAKAKQSREYGLDYNGHPNWFDASYISWLSYDSLHLELPDGYLHLMPIVNWGRFREENGRKLMPLTVRLNHAVADGYLVAKVFALLEQAIADFCREK